VRILRSVRHKACADGTFMKEFLVDEPVTAEFLKHLRTYGTVKMLSGIRDGFFEFGKPHFFTIKGFIGDRQFEVRFTKEYMDLTTDFLYLLVSRYPPGQKDIEFLRTLEDSLQKKIRVRLGEP
jgi:hypothetical protein